MNAKTLISLFLVTLVCSTGFAAAQAPPPPPASNERGMDNEFGSVRLPYTVDVSGQRAEITAKVLLRKNYEDKDSRFFMFAWSVRGTPMDVTFDNLVRSDTGKELPCYQRQGTGNDQLKCFVDLRDMPPAGTEIVMRGTVGSSRAGSFNVGAIVEPFTYTWGTVPMSNGLEAQLYGDTMVNVQQTTGGGSNRLSGLGNSVPGVETVGVLGALAVVAIGLAVYRRKDDA